MVLTILIQNLSPRDLANKTYATMGRPNDEAYIFPMRLHKNTPETKCFFIVSFKTVTSYSLVDKSLSAKIMQGMNESKLTKTLHIGDFLFILIPRISHSNKSPLNNVKSTYDIQ